MSADDPRWNSGDPQTWDTYYKAVYQIEGAPEVVVNQHCRSEQAAKTQSVEALTEALKKVVELGLQVQASAWTVKHQSRRQTRSFPAANVHPLVTRQWYGSLTVVAGGMGDGDPV